MGNTHSTLKNVTEPIIVCQQNNQDDSCNLPWEWRNSTSSDNTDNSLSNVQDCVNSLLCSTSSDMPDESSTKDPVAGGGFCYTPMYVTTLLRNISMCAIILRHVLLILKIIAKFILLPDTWT